MVKMKLLFRLFWVDVLLTVVTIACLVLTQNLWFIPLALFTAWCWFADVKKYREIMKNPLIYLWFIQEEFADKPQVKENCKLWIGNKGICKPLTEDRCQTCGGYQKKRRWLW